MKSALRILRQLSAAMSVMCLSSCTSQAPYEAPSVGPTANVTFHADFGSTYAVILSLRQKACSSEGELRIGELSRAEEVVSISYPPVVRFPTSVRYREVKVAANRSQTFGLRSIRISYAGVRELLHQCPFDVTVAVRPNTNYAIGISNLESGCAVAIDTINADGTLEPLPESEFQSVFRPDCE